MDAVLRALVDAFVDDVQAVGKTKEAAGKAKESIKDALD